MKRFFAAAVITALMAAPTLASDVLWDQGPDPAAGAFVDQAFGDFPDFSTFMVSDVEFTFGVDVDSVTTYFTNANLTWPQSGVGEAIFNIYGSAPGAGDDPSTGAVVEVTYEATADGLSVTTSGLDLNLDAGTYWIGLTPILDFGVFGQEFHQTAAAAFGGNTLARNPGGGFGVGTDWIEAGPVFGGIDYDAAITVTGKAKIPEPTTAGLLAVGLVGLVARRRR